MSFSAEMKDFLTAYKTGQSINASRTDQDYKEAKTEAEKLKTTRDNDPDTLKLTTETARADLANKSDQLLNNASARATQAAARVNSAAQADYVRSGTAIRNQRMYEMQNRKPAPAPGTEYPTGAVDTGEQPALTPKRDAYGNILYADGGLVDDGEPDEDGVLDTAEIPTPAGAPTDVSARSRQIATAPSTGLENVISPELGRDAVREGVTYGITKAGLHQQGAIRSPAAQRKAQLIAQGAGSLSEEELNAARKAVDPDDRMTESQRNMAALGSVYQFFANKGETEKAQRVAFQVIQSYRSASQRYAAIAAKAAESGNVDLATKAAIKAYANVPDGNDLSIQLMPDGQLKYHVTGPDGKTIDGGLATPKQLAAAATGLTTGGFDKAILSSFGAADSGGAVNAGKSGKSGAGKTQSGADKAEMSEQFDNEIKTARDAQNKKSGLANNPETPGEADYYGDLKDTMTHLVQQNQHLTPREARMAAEQLIAPEAKAKNPKSVPFKAEPLDGGGYTIKFDKGGQPVKLDDEQFDAIVNKRTARANSMLQVEEAAKVAKEAAGKRQTEAIGGLKQIASGVSNIENPLKVVPKMAYEALEDAMLTDPKQRPSRIGAIADTLSKVGGAVGDATQNKGAIPVDDNDRPL